MHIYIYIYIHVHICMDNRGQFSTLRSGDVGPAPRDGELRKGTFMSGSAPAEQHASEPTIRRPHRYSTRATVGHFWVKMSHGSGTLASDLPHLDIGPSL